MTGRTTTKRSRLRLAKQLEPHLENIRRQWPRQCEAIHTKLDELNRLESANSTDWMLAMPLAHCWRGVQRGRISGPLP